MYLGRSLGTCEEGIPTPPLNPSSIVCTSSSQCPVGYGCIQQPMCSKGAAACVEVVKPSYCAILTPTSTVSPVSCTLLSQGDANCDRIINEVDFAEFKKKMNNLPLSRNSIVDFNNDTKVDLLDFEIWRNNAYK